MRGRQKIEMRFHLLALLLHVLAGGAAAGTTRAAGAEAGPAERCTAQSPTTTQAVCGGRVSGIACSAPAIIRSCGFSIQIFPFMGITLCIAVWPKRPPCKIPASINMCMGPIRSILLSDCRARCVAMATA